MPTSNPSNTLTELRFSGLQKEQARALCGKFVAHLNSPGGIKPINMDVGGLKFMVWPHNTTTEQYVGHISGCNHTVTLEGSIMQDYSGDEDE